MTTLAKFNCRVCGKLLVLVKESEEECIWECQNTECKASPHYKKNKKIIPFLSSPKSGTETGELK